MTGIHAGATESEVALHRAVRQRGRRLSSTGGKTPLVVRPRWWDDSAGKTPLVPRLRRGRHSGVVGDIKPDCDAPPDRRTSSGYAPARFPASVGIAVAA